MHIRLHCQHSFLMGSSAVGKSALAEPQHHASRSCLQSQSRQPSFEPQHLTYDQRPWVSLPVLKPTYTGKCQEALFFSEWQSAGPQLAWVAMGCLTGVHLIAPHTLLMACQALDLVAAAQGLMLPYLQDDDVLSQETEEINGVTYYRWWASLMLVSAHLTWRLMVAGSAHGCMQVVDCCRCILQTCCTSLPPLPLPSR